jgi:Holliday junction resolvase
LRALRKKGWLCSRSAASHGPVDVFAAKNGRVLIIQVKSGRSQVKDEDKEILKKWAKAYNARAEVWRFSRAGGLKREIVYDASINRNSTRKFRASI